MRLSRWVYLIVADGVAEAAVDDDRWPAVAREVGRHEGEVTVEVIRNTAEDQWPRGRRPGCPVCGKRLSGVRVPGDVLAAPSPSFVIACAGCQYQTVACASIIDAWAEWFANALVSGRQQVAA